MFTFLHLTKSQLNLNGESGNLDVLVSRLRWSGIEAQVIHFDGSGKLPSQVDAVFIGSGTLAGALEALNLLEPHRQSLQALSRDNIPFLALGLGWEILGESLVLTSGEKIIGLGVYPSRSVRVEKRASEECFGYDSRGNLTAGYANHSAEIEIFEGAKPLIELIAGFGNSSITPAPQRNDEGLLSGNLMAARLNGPLLAINPHLADQFIVLMSDRSGFDYIQNSEAASKADGYATRAREELKLRLTR